MLSILDQALAYCGSTITADQVRELLGVVGAEVLDALVEAILTQSSEKMLTLVDALVRDGHNLQHFCREALRHVRNLLVVRIGGPAAALAEAAGPEREKLDTVARHFSEEDLLRFFQVLLRTEGELRWSPQPRLHLELGLLKLVQAERLVPLEEVLAELSGNPVAAPARKQPEPVPPGATPRSSAAPSPAPTASSIEASTIEAIKAAVYGQSKFLGSFMDNVAHWEREKGSLHLWFSPENRSLSEMLGKKQQGELEKIISQVLGEPIRIYPKVGSVSASAPPARRDRKSTRLNSSHIQKSRMPSSA